MPVEIRAIAGSAVRHPPGAGRVREVDPARHLEASVYLKPEVTQPARATREQMRVRRTAEHSGDIQNIAAFAAEHGLRVVSVAPGRRLVRLSGSAAQFGAAFRTAPGMYDAGRGEYRYDGSLSVPAVLAPSIEMDDRRDHRAACGLSHGAPATRPQARWHGAIPR